MAHDLLILNGTVVSPAGVHGLRRQVALAWIHRIDELRKASVPVVAGGKRELRSFLVVHDKAHRDPGPVRPEHVGDTASMADEVALRPEAVHGARHRSSVRSLEHELKSVAGPLAL